ncbi:MAG TPA: GNAT family N-acetyltransferase [Pyrinomonadaceae bacterium]|nr:GNAT family N-acetyltransferase [Pyrinomonadaceae bacterium]
MSSTVQQGMGWKLRPGRMDDADALGRICFTAFKTIADQHNFPSDFDAPERGIGLLTMLLGRPDAYSVVAEDESGRLLGSNFLWEGDAIAGVGPITVDPEVQNSSVGRALMTDVLRHADEKKFLSVRLVQSAYHNRSLSLYTKLGFDAVEPLSCMQGLALNVEVPGRKVRSMTTEDIAAADALAFRVHGHTRSAEVAGAVEQGTATIVEYDGRVTGYATLVGFFGHAVGESNDDIKALIGAAPSFPGAGFLLPTRNGELLRWCLNHGLRIVQPLTLMSRGVYQEPRGAFLPSILF